MKDLWKNHWLYFVKKAHLDRASFVEVVRKNRHPLAHGFFCDGTSYEAWLEREWPEPRFSEAAAADKNVLPYQSIEDTT